ncbi:hypothetical protein BGZ61DRAFT_460003 [Ilyonectria robusta]|uniref:uncharacterized protein n=1 Tax=Ilyonectria robusta TaxID=1079257 RepID=UPI001E8E260E|nr:uncharacterized protein BGZ61DRAFT_460003 [Ilyonectria robusta]KAH8669823.1 hypothetical protein BGZ61DRAFT_460003 [Ilyonectria robusta]
MATPDIHRDKCGTEPPPTVSMVHNGSHNFVNQSGEPARDPRSQAGGRLGAASNERDRGGDRMGWMALPWDDATMGRGLDGARGRTDGGQRTGMNNSSRGVGGLVVEWLSGLRHRHNQDKHGVSGVSDFGPSQGVSAGGG